MPPLPGPFCLRDPLQSANAPAREWVFRRFLASQARNPGRRGWKPLPRQPGHPAPPRSCRWHPSPNPPRWARPAQAAMRPNCPGRHGKGGWRRRASAANPVGRSSSHRQNVPWSRAGHAFGGIFTWPGICSVLAGGPKCQHQIPSPRYPSRRWPRPRPRQVSPRQAVPRQAAPRQAPPRQARQRRRPRRSSRDFWHPC